MKRDNMKMMAKIDSVTISNNDLKKDLSALKEDQQSVDSRIQFLEEAQTEQKSKVTQAVNKVVVVEEQIKVLQGLVQKQNQILTLQKTDSENTRLKDMRNNLVISGLDKAEEDAETETTTTELVTDFFSQVMKIQQPIEIQSAVRIGKSTPRSVLVKLKSVKDKGMVFKNVKNLKEVHNSKDGLLFVNNQLPPRLQEQQWRYRQLVHYNNSLAGVGKRTMTYKKGELYVDGQRYTSAIQPPTIAEAVFPLHQSHVDRIQLLRGDTQVKGNCQFIGYATEINSVADVRAAYTKVKRLHSGALHIACGYRLPGLDFITLRGYEDDGEHGAGRTIYKSLEDQNIYHMAVFVVRHYGNKHLGDVRFQLITAATKTAIMCLKAKLGASSFTEQIPATWQQDQDIVVGETTVAQVAAKSVNQEKSKGYLSATSPRPFSSFKPNWGSVESVSNEGHSMDFRSRANSFDSNASVGSYGSFTSADMGTQ